MDSGYIPKTDSPILKANILSKFVFNWMINVCYKCYKSDIQLSDLYKLTPTHKSRQLTDKLETAWKNEIIKSNKSQTKPSLWKAIFKTTLKDMFCYTIIFIVDRILIKSFLPLVLAYFIHELSKSVDVDYKIYAIAAVLLIFTLIDNVLLQHVDLIGSVIGMDVRVAVTNLVYRKILTVNSSDQTAVGQIVNLISNDVNRFDLIFGRIVYILTFPIFLVLMCFLVWTMIGSVAFIGIVVPLIVTTLQYILSHKLKLLRRKVATFTGERVKLIHEMVVGMKIIKMYVWEKPFEELITKVRNSEIGALKTFFYVRPIVALCLYLSTDRLCLFLTVSVYVFLTGEISASKLFALATLSDTFINFGNGRVSLAFVSLAETITSVARIQEFLLLPEKSCDTIETNASSGVSLKNVFARYPKSESDVLKNLDFYLPVGSLCVIIGSVGSGKSSFLQLLLGELDIKNGTITASKDISYASQNPWIFSSTVRNNIVFGQEFNESIYKKVIEVCALDNDLKEFSHGDLTIVGERGVVLSGGQRARINLARAVYKNSQIVLLDDPLSAVDAHVGKHIFDECIVKFLKNKTRILVTHQLQYIETADLIVVLEDGEVKAKGTFKEILAKNLDIVRFIKDVTKSQNKVAVRLNNESSNEKELKPQEIKQEEMHSSKSTPFRDYLSASGNTCKIVVVLLFCILSQALYNATDYWVTIWTRRSGSHIEIIELNSNKSNSDFEKIKYSHVEDSFIPGLGVKESWILIYGMLTLLACVFIIFKQLFMAQMLLNASCNLHSRMLKALIHTPLRFFDVNPSGRILNRFSKDMGIVDELAPLLTLSTFQLFSLAIGSVVMVVIANYFMVIPAVVLALVFYKFTVWFVVTNIKVKHLESVAHSPVFSYVNWTLNGLSTIRSFKNEEILKREFENHQDLHSSAWLLSLTTKAAFSFWLKMVCFVLMALTTLASIFLRSYQVFSTSDIGLAIFQCMMLLSWLQNCLMMLNEFSNSFTNVERIVQYTELESEDRNGDCLEDDQWIKAGSIEFKNVTLQYNKEDPEVLKNINFVINPGDKIGIVGRTGAGKSSLISVLFRLTNFDGQILIDGKDTKSLKLEDLRRNISIIPQEPVLFSATLRYNLDPFHEYDDEQLWKALDEVKLKEAIKSLDCLVSEDGSNFSLGQRQLLCLARAILRNNKIFVLDEATANIDLKTDSLIQQTIREKFVDCTVLTIAHRLDTIMDSDKILVMDFGQVIEFDTPETLLKNPDGSFSRLLESIGKAL